MFRSLLGAMFITFAFVCSVSAQISATGSSYQARNTSSRQQNTSSLSILDNFSRTVAPAALSNIRNSETAFCYTVTSASGNYTGYTLDGYAVTGFCGILQKHTQFCAVKLPAPRKWTPGDSLPPPAAGYPPPWGSPPCSAALPLALLPHPARFRSHGCIRPTAYNNRKS